MMLYPLVRPFLFLLPPERAHHLTLFMLKNLARFRCLPSYAPKNPKPVEVMGLTFPNWVGLAAGLDKNGVCIHAFSKLGFGFVEVGTVTPKAQPGNPSPRMFRLPKHRALINRMGFNNNGVAALVTNILSQKRNCLLGVNIGKNKDTPLEKAQEDYLFCLEKVYPHCDYVTINISSPNTPGLRQLQDPKVLSALLTVLKKRQSELAEQHKKKVPLVVKLSPDLTKEDIQSIGQVLLETKVDGVIATNTTLDKMAVENAPHGQEAGGLSGEPLFAKSLEVVSLLYGILGEDIPIIGSGGIMQAKQAEAFLQAGAKLVQIYTGLIYRGPGFIKDIGSN